jgi:aminopeptidase N
MLKTLPGTLALLITLLFSTALFAQSGSDYCALKKRPSLANSFLRAANTRSDSFDIRHYNIVLDVRDFTGQTISGLTEIEFEALIGTSSDPLEYIDFDLQGLTVDSVVSPAGLQTFSHVGNRLRIDLSPALESGDVLDLAIFYGGSPQKDPSWGGWYWNGDYAYNMGVAFDLEPHNFGRVWYPCFDNFVERATYSFVILTDSNKRAACNGILTDSFSTAEGRSWVWNLSQEIPTYLSSIAVAPYTTVEFDHPGLDGNIPVVYHAVESDTVNMKNAFSRLGIAIDAFEAGYGAHQFEKIGFTAVPFFGGAMEHATSIHYPRFGLSTDWERLWAHELAHHWWGDLVTCRTAEDMWLNEGWASYSEYYFLEIADGWETAHNALRETHLDMLQYAHVYDGDFLPVSGIGHEDTYGSHVYDKGALIAHNLRQYLGDDFFPCITGYLNDNSFSDASSADFRDALTACSGKDMSAFFDNWVYGTGWAGFSVDSFNVIDLGSSWWVRVYVRQRLHEATEYFDNVPLDIEFRGDNWEQHQESMEMSGVCGYYETILDFEPSWVGMDPGKRLMDASTFDAYVVNAPRNIDSEYGKIELDVIDPGSDSAFIRLDHYWTGQDAPRTFVSGLHVNSRRYWKISGLISDDFSATGRFLYNGTLSSSGGYLDNELISNTEDSLVLLFRTDASEDWQEYPDYDIDVWGITSDGRGEINLSQVIPGEYVLGIYDHSRVEELYEAPDACGPLQTSIPFIGPEDRSAINPNPADQMVIWSCETCPELELLLYDYQGRLRLHQNTGAASSVQLDLSSLGSGIFFLFEREGNSMNFSQKLVVEH